MKNFKKFVRIMKVLTIPSNIGMKSSIGIISKVLDGPDDYIGPDSMTRWIIKKSQSFTDVGLLRISKSGRAYAY